MKCCHIQRMVFSRAFSADLLGRVTGIFLLQCFTTPAAFYAIPAPISALAVCVLQCRTP